MDRCYADRKALGFEIFASDLARIGMLFRQEYSNGPQSLAGFSKLLFQNQKAELMPAIRNE